ncbi:MAG: hypothetical protein ACRC6B_01745 [Fusobacteriaceae bacterium]
MLLIILSLFSLQITSSDFVNSVIGEVFYKQIGVRIENNYSLLSAMLWLLLFGTTSKYYQVVIQIERQYNYIHHLEEMININYNKTKAFTREGVSYLNEYPLFSSWIWFIYTLAFPTLILTSIMVRIRWELANTDFLSFSQFSSLLLYFLIGTSTILYMIKLHHTTISNLISKIKN